ncbi:MAG: hypothetical protein R3C11_11740 [Planctomycetaceae bacterium]
MCDAVATSYINDVTYSRTLATIALRATSRPLIGTVSMACICDVRQRISQLQRRVFAQSIPLLILCGMSVLAIIVAVLLTGGELTEAAVEETEKVLAEEFPDEVKDLQSNQNVNRKVEYRVVDSVGEPLKGVTFQYGSLVSGRTDESGSITLDHIKGAGASYTLRKDGYLGKTLKKKFEPIDSPVDVTLRKVITIRAKVIDAMTGQALSGFSLIKGVKYNPQLNEKIQWQPLENDIKDKENTFQFSDQLKVEEWVVKYRIECPGYITQQSREWNPEEITGDTVDIEFALDKREGQTREILTPEEGPASQAKLWIKTIASDDKSTPKLVLRNGEAFLNAWTKPVQSVTADNEGVIQVPSGDKKFAGVFVHESGYREISDIELYENERLTLNPWQEVKGRVLIEGKPESQLKIMSAYHVLPGTYLKNWGEGGPIVFYLQQTDVDASGQFVLPRGPRHPGTLVVAGTGLNENDQSERINWVAYYDLEPEPEQELIIGDDEVDVVGKVKFREEQKEALLKSFIEFVSVPRSETPGCRVLARIEADGTFRCPNLKPGRYTGSLRKKTIPGLQNFSSDPFQFSLHDVIEETWSTGRLELTPDSFTGKGPGNPVDLGLIELEKIR